MSPALLLGTGRTQTGVVRVCMLLYIFMAHVSRVDMVIVVSLYCVCQYGEAELATCDQCPLQEAGRRQPAVQLACEI